MEALLSILFLDVLTLLGTDGELGLY